MVHRWRLSQSDGPCRVEIPVQWKLGAAFISPKILKLLLYPQLIQNGSVLLLLPLSMCWDLHYMRTQAMGELPHTNRFSGRKLLSATESVCFLKAHKKNGFVSCHMSCVTCQGTCQLSPEKHSMQFQLLWKSQEVWWGGCGRFGDW